MSHPISTGVAGAIRLALGEPDSACAEKGGAKSEVLEREQSGPIPHVARGLPSQTLLASRIGRTAKVFELRTLPFREG